MSEVIADNAAPAPATETPASNGTTATLTQDVREAWNKGETGPATSTQDPSKTGDSATPETPSDIAPGAEPGTSPQDKAGKGKTKEDSEKRWKELSEDRGRLQREVEELKRQVSAPRDTRQTSQPAAETKPAEVVARPKMTDVDPRTQKPYADLDNFHEDLAKWATDQAVREMDGRQSKAQKEQQDRQLAESRKVLIDKFNERTAKTREKLPDFDDVALKTPLPIREGSVADAFLMESDHGPEMLYELAKNVPEIERIQKLNPIAQARELFRLELLHGGLDALKQDPRFAELLTQPVIPVVKAPKPPSEVGGRGTSQPDSLETAAASGDFRRFSAEATRRALASNKS